MSRIVAVVGEEVHESFVEDGNLTGSHILILRDDCSGYEFIPLKSNLDQDATTYFTLMYYSYL